MKLTEGKEEDHREVYECSEGGHIRVWCIIKQDEMQADDPLKKPLKRAAKTRIP